MGLRALAALGVVAALSAPPALARGGGIESQSCIGCHGTGAASTTLSLTPASFDPGDTVTVRVTLTGTGASGGLFLTTGGVGAFATVAGQSTRLLNGNVVQSSPKAASGGSVTFDVRWTAPATMGGVDFEVATVLANGNGASSGDQAGAARLSVAFGCAGTTYFRDVDGDGVGSTASGTTRHCMPPPGFSTTDGDCDDFDDRRTPGTSERCNGLDDDCDGQVDEGLTAVTTWPDVDGDGYGDARGVPASGCGGGGRVQNDRDCDDGNRAINPGATETCNLEDDDCDGQVDDGARVRCGVGWCARLGPTCDVNDCTPGPPLLERCNALDDDCDGVVDDGDLCSAGARCEAGVCVAPPDGGPPEPVSPRGESAGSCASVPGGPGGWWRRCSRDGEGERGPSARPQRLMTKAQAESSSTFAPSSASRSASVKESSSRSTWSIFAAGTPWWPRESLMRSMLRSRSSSMSWRASSFSASSWRFATSCATLAASSVKKPSSGKAAGSSLALSERPSTSRRTGNNCGSLLALPPGCSVTATGMSDALR